MSTLKEYIEYIIDTRALTDEEKCEKLIELDVDAIPHLIQIFVEHDYPDICVRMTLVLYGSDVVPQLVEAFKLRPNLQILICLEQIGEPAAEAIPVLLALIGPLLDSRNMEKDKLIAHKIQYALGKMPEGVSPWLSRMLLEGNWFYRLYAVGIVEMATSNVHSFWSIIPSISKRIKAIRELGVSEEEENYIMLDGKYRDPKEFKELLREDNYCSIEEWILEKCVLIIVYKLDRTNCTIDRYESLYKIEWSRPEFSLVYQVCLSKALNVEITYDNINTNEIVSRFRPEFKNRPRPYTYDINPYNYKYNYAAFPTPFLDV